MSSIAVEQIMANVGYRPIRAAIGDDNACVMRNARVSWVKEEVLNLADFLSFSVILLWSFQLMELLVNSKVSACPIKYNFRLKFLFI